MMHRLRFPNNKILALEERHKHVTTERDGTTTKVRTGWWMTVEPGNITVYVGLSKPVGFEVGDNISITFEVVK